MSKLNRPALKSHRPLAAAALAGALVMGGATVAAADEEETAPPVPPTGLPDLGDYVVHHNPEEWTVRHDPGDWVEVLGESPNQSANEEEDVVVLEADS